ncbi:MAG: TrbC/VirB2 family protein [Lactobacillales bacterium]|jgi:type IV secretory pathway VirB2 component (pilin)|nr:TrbC/VirB2 family protein [Lactobacillales bacterium]
MNKMLKYLSWAAVFTLAFVATSALATENANNKLFDEVLNRMVTTFQNTRSVIFVVGGFGLVALAFFAIFGKVKWTWLAALAVGLAIVAVAGAVVDYVTQPDGSSGASDIRHLDNTLIN